MATRTSYYALEFRRGELKHIEEKEAEEFGIDQTDLDRAEARALAKVNQFIVRVAGARVGATIVQVFLDDTNAMDPLVEHLAELIAAADILEHWERHNFANETRDGNTIRQDPEAVRGRATRCAQDIIDAGGTVTATGTFRRWYYASNQQGPRVTGPMRAGSYFHTGDTTQYDDAGNPIEGPIDPARWAGRS